MQQRSVIQFTKANPLQSMTALEQAISLPHEYAPIRYPSFPALERTAVMSFNVPQTLSFPAGATTLRGALHRQAAWPLWVEKDADRYCQLTYYAVLDCEGNTSTPTDRGMMPLLCAPSPAKFSVANTTATSTTVGVSNCIQPSHVYPLLGSHLDKVYTYVPAGAAFAWIIHSGSHATTGVANVSVTYEIWRGGNAVDTGETARTSITGTNLNMMTLNEYLTGSAWVRPVNVLVSSDVFQSMGEWTVVCAVTGAGITYSPSTATMGTLSLSAGTRTLFLPFAPPPEFDVTERPWKDTKTTAAALLLTNVTKVLNKEGTVLAGRLANTYDGAWSFDASSLSVLHPAEKSMLALETGFYTYAPPSTDLSTFYNHVYDPTNVFASVGSSPLMPLFNLDNTAYANCFILTDSDASTPSTFAANLDWHIEFRNNSTLFPIGMSAITLEAFHQAILNLVSHGFFFSNHTHKPLLNKIFAEGRKLAPLAMGMLPPPARLAAGMGLKIADRMLSKKPQTTPPATSAKGSGMLSSKSGSGRKKGNQGKKNNKRR